MEVATYLEDAVTWTTAISNATGLTLNANGQPIPAAGSPVNVPSTATGVSIQVPGIGEIRLIDAGAERPGSLKVVSGAYANYVSSTGSITARISVSPAGEYVFSIPNSASAQPVGRSSPDSVFPVASIGGDVVHDGVNLFTGDVNQAFPLVGISDGRLEYRVDAFYNSRSVGLGVPADDNVLHAHGWKLMDYPKIVEEGGLTYFLDGYASYVLTPNPGGWLETGGDYCGWVFPRDPMTHGWMATNDRGISYRLGSKGQLLTGRTVWHLSSIVDLQNATGKVPSTIGFSYKGNQIVAIKNSLGDEIEFSYDTTGALSFITRSVQIDRAPKVPTEQVVLDYATTSPSQLVAIRRGTILPTGAGNPVDGGYLFRYNAADDSRYPLALASVQSPLGAVVFYSYYNGEGIVSGGRSFSDVHPVVKVQNQPDGTTKVPTRLVYSFWNWQFDPTQTYAHWNLAQEYVGALYGNTDDEDRYGHTSFLFCTGQPASQLHYYTDDAAVAANPAVVGKVYWSGNFKMVQTTSTTVLDDTAVGFWPGVLVPLALPAAAQITSVSCEAWKDHLDPADMALAIENAGQQIHGIYQDIDEVGGQPMGFDLHVLGPTTHVRAWSCLSDEARMRTLKVTYIVPPDSPVVPPDTGARHPERVVVSGFLNLIPTAPGKTFSFSSPYTTATEVTIDFRNKRGGPSTITVTCYNGAGLAVATGKFEASAGHSASGTVPVPYGAAVARITVSASGGDAALQDLFLSYLLAGEPVTDDALADELSFEHSVYAIGRSGTTSFAKTASTSTSIDGVVQQTTIAYGDDRTTPYPKVVTQTVVKPDQDGGSASVTRQRQLTYTSEKYPAATTIGMKGVVAEVIDVAAPGDLPSNPPAVAGAVTQWKSWGATWGEWRQFRLQSPKVTDGFAPTPDASWRAGETVTVRSDRGAALAKVNSDGVVSSVLLDRPYRFWTVATFENANVTAKEAGWLGFESYEDLTPWWLVGAKIVQGQAYTGAAVCASNGTDQLTVGMGFTPRPGASYLVAAYVRLNPGTEAAPASCRIGFRNGTPSWSVSETISFDPQQPGWRYVQAIGSGTQLDGYFPTVDIKGGGAIDHFVFAPVDCQYEARVWDLPRRCVTATVGANGAVRRTFYDSSRNPLASAGPGRSLSVVDQSYSSVLGQMWFGEPPSYSADAPNQAMRTQCGSHASWDDFTSILNPVFPPANLSNMTRTGNHLMAATVQTQVGTAQAAITPAPDFAVFAEVLLGPTPPVSTQSIGLTVRYAGTSNDVLLGLAAGAVVLTDVSTGVQLKSKPMAYVPPAVVLTLVVRGGTTLCAYADGVLLFEHTVATAVTGGCGLRSSVPGAALYNFGYTAAPELTNVTSNADGDAMQHIAASSASSSTISERLFGGDRMLYAGRTLQTTQASSSLAPVAGFARLDGNTMTVIGSVTAGWPDAYKTTPFADSRQHFPDPLQRPLSRGRAGIYTAGQDGALTYAYGEDMDAYFSFPKEQLNTTTKSGLTGAKVVTYTNRVGTTFGKARIDPGSSASLLTGYEYDTALRLIATYFPNAYSSPTHVDKTIFNRRITYDFLNEVTATVETDSGRTAFAYSSAGRRRLLQDAAGAAAAPPYCVYAKYDRLGRLVEEGTWNGTLATVTQAQLDDLSWPPDGTWSRRFTWDVPNGSEANAHGRLTAAATLDVVQQYVYDASGRPTQVTTKLSGSTTQLALGYDGVGRLKSMSEPASGYDVQYAYDEQGRLTSVGTSANPVAYASYAYHNDTVTETLLGNAVTRRYTMNALGDLQSIADDFFTETLFFDTRASGGTGYRNGQIASAKYAFNWPGAPLPEYVYEYYYDAFGRLTRADNSVNPAWSIGTATAPVAYDNNGNIQSLTRGGTTVAFNYIPTTNRLSDFGGPGQSFAYDANGNVTASAWLRLRGMCYDPVSNALTFANDMMFVADAAGRRVLRRDGHGQRTYVRDLQGRVLVETSDSSNVRYVYGLRGRVAMLDDAGATYALLTDHNHSPRAAVTSAGQVVAWYNYDPFGELLKEISNVGSIGLRYLYTGQEWDEGLGLYDFGARLYDPGVCRFYSVDPARQFASPYIYSNNPVSFEDPTGEVFLLDDLAVMFVGALVGAVVGAGLEVAREVVTGEPLSAAKIGLGAGAGAVAGGLAYITGGQSLVEAGKIVAKGIAMGAATGAGLNAAMAVTRGENVGHALLTGAVTGAQSGMLSAAVTPFATAMWIGRPVVGSALDSVVLNATRETMTGVVIGGVTSFATTGLRIGLGGPSSAGAMEDLLLNVAVGGLTGGGWSLAGNSWRNVQMMRHAAGFRRQMLAENGAELLPLI